MRRVRFPLAVLAAVMFVGPAVAAEQVDLLLVLASDVSRSVDAAKFKLQRDGYVAAISNPRVIEAIKSGPHGRIAICFIEWSGVGAQRVVIDWTVIDGVKAAQDFASQLDEALAQNVTINGLVILSEQPLSWNADHTNPPGGLEAYYRNNVTGGPNSFVMVAENFNTFGQAILNKLVAEVAAADGAQQTAAAQ